MLATAPNGATIYRLVDSLTAVSSVAASSSSSALLILHPAPSSRKPSKAISWLVSALPPLLRNPAELTKIRKRDRNRFESLTSNRTLWPEYWLYKGEYDLSKPITIATSTIPYTVQISRDEYEKTAKYLEINYLVYVAADSLMLDGLCEHALSEFRIVLSWLSLLNNLGPVAVAKMVKDLFERGGAVAPRQFKRQAHQMMLDTIRPLTGMLVTQQVRDVVNQWNMV